VIESHLYKTILKSKSIHDSGLLPSYVRCGTKWNESSSEEVAAISNVTARLYNTKLVKEAMSQIMESIYAILGIQNPSNTTKIKNIERGALGNAVGERTRSAEHNIEEDVGGRDSLSPDKYPGTFEIPTQLATSDADSNSKLDLESDDAQESDDTHDALIVGSSDEESNGDVDRASPRGHSNSNLGILEQPNDAPTSLPQSPQSPSCLPLWEATGLDLNPPRTMKT
jgi:hypothetical protein